MISKSLFINLQKEDMKRRIWSIALLILLFFIVLPVFCALTLEDYTDNETRKWVIESLIQYIGPQNYGVTMLTILSAVICGISGFFYLHSKKRVDFYHSMPVKRQTMFAVGFSNGFFIYFVPYIINLLLALLVLAVQGFLSSEIIQAVIAAVVLNAVYFLMIYTIVIIAVMLTGNFIINCFGVAVLLLYGPTLMLVKELYCREFFWTYYPEQRLMTSMKFLSPIWVYAAAIERWGAGDSIVKSVLIGLAVTVVLIAFAVFLYLKRPSEASGKAMAFEVSKPIIKFLLLVLLSLGGGALFFNIVQHSDGWFIFGMIFSLLVVHTIIEIIYSFDIRGAFHHKLQLLVATVAVAVIACLFRFDLVHYDTYLPEKNKVQSMSVYVGGFETNINYYDYSKKEPVWYNSEEYHLKNMDLKDISTAYELAQMGTESIANLKNENSDARYCNYTVKYKLSNGRTVYRNYALDAKQSYPQLKELYANEEFKETHYPILRWGIREIGQVSLRYFSNILNDNEFGMDGKENFTLSLNQEAKKEFIDTYSQELRAMSLDEISQTQPLLTLQLEVNKYDNAPYYIYPSFKKTLALVQQYGFDYTKEVTPKDILRVEVYDYRPEDQKPVNEDGVSETIQVTYTDQDQIASIMPLLISSDYCYYNSLLIDSDNDINVSFYVMNANYKDEISYSYLFRKDEIPGFILEDLQQQKASQ